MFCKKLGAAQQRAIHHCADFLGVKPLSQRGRAHHVQEQDAHLLEGLDRPRRLRRVGLQAGEFGAERGERHIHHPVAQQRALGFEHIDPGKEVLSSLRHGPRISTPQRAALPALLVERQRS